MKIKIITGFALLINHVDQSLVFAFDQGCGNIMKIHLRRQVKYETSLALSKTYLSNIATTKHHLNKNRFGFNKRNNLWLKLMLALDIKMLQKTYQKYLM